MILSMMYSFSFYPLIFPSLLSHRSWFLGHCLINLLNTEFCPGICFLESPYGKSKNSCGLFSPLLETSFDVIFTQTSQSVFSVFARWSACLNLWPLPPLLCQHITSHNPCPLLSCVLSTSNTPKWWALMPHRQTFLNSKRRLFFPPAWDIGSGVHIASLKSHG